MENKTKKVIQVSHLTKMYKLYDKPSDRLKEALGVSKKKRYREHYALHDINFDVKEGECVGIIGTNGSGKSTILKSITRQLMLIAGTVYIDRQSIREMTEKDTAKKMAVVLTERIRPELMTCEDVVNTGRYPYTGRLGILSEEDHQKVQEAMKLVHAEELADCDFSEISDGQRQRILLARAICQEPEIIILDEPTSFLDIRHKLELLTILKDMVRQRNVAVIMSLHELDLAQKISDQVICVHGNKIERYGAPEEIFTSDYIKTLYGVTKGSYNADFGCLELEPARGEPEVFVIAGNGSGIPVFRKLQRKGIPFAAGVLNENDIDCQVAKALAVEVVTEKAFCEISDSTLDRARALMHRCKKVVCCLKEYGTINEKNRLLQEEAEKNGNCV